MRKLKQRFPHIVSTGQILQSARQSIEVILERVTSNVSCASQAKRPWIMRERRTHRNRELDGESLLAARVRLNASGPMA